MKWYIWLIIAVVAIIIIYVIFGKKSNDTPIGSAGDPITNAGSGTGNQNPSAFDWFENIITPALVAAIDVLPEVLNSGKKDDEGDTSSGE